MTNNHVKSLEESQKYGLDYDVFDLAVIEGRRRQYLAQFSTEQLKLELTCLEDIESEGVGTIPIAVALRQELKEREL
jgi:hypothetical protein